MTHYKLRITHSHESTLIKDPEAVHKILLPDITLYSRCFEGLGTDHEHIHYYIVSDAKEATIRSHLRKIGAGNKTWSLKELSVDTSESEFAVSYLAYMYKEGNGVSSNMPTAWLDEAKSHNLKVYNEIKEKKSKRRPQLQILREKFKDRADLDCVTIVDEIISYYKEERILVRKFQLVCLAQTLMLEFLPEYAVDLSTMIHKDLFVRN